MQGGFFLKINKHADQNKAVHIGWNKCAGGNFFSKPINMQTKIRLCRGKFFIKINKRACTSIRYSRVCASKQDMLVLATLEYIFQAFKTSQPKSHDLSNSLSTSAL